MSDSPLKLQLAAAPHLHAGGDIGAVMRQVIYALLPATAFSLYVFGTVAILVLLTALFSCALTEWCACRFAGKANTLGDCSALVTGLIYALTLPPNLPLWMVALGGVVSIGVGKLLFGGLGHTVFNPALVGRAFLQAAFPAAMTTWLPPLGSQRFASLPESTLALPFAHPHYDVVATATPLAAQKFSQQSTPLWDLFVGVSSGSLGETSALLLLLGGIYLVVRGIADWRIPVSILASVGLMSAFLHGIDDKLYPSASFMWCAGGLMLGAWFMATDPVAAPITATGRIVYGVLIAMLVVIIRLWGGMAEGVMYAILLGNAVAPLIERYLQPRVYGH